MIRLGRCFCQTCGKEHYGTGRLGMSQQCSCGAWIPKATLDRVRYYWIFQVAISFAIATFFFTLALCFRDLPLDPWQRFFSPILQVPATASFIVSYLSIVRIKRTDDGDSLMVTTLPAVNLIDQLEPFEQQLAGYNLCSPSFVDSLISDNKPAHKILF